MGLNEASKEGSFDSDHKILIRENWNLPLIKFFAKKYADKLVYIGLPSSKAEDILTWIDFIKSVIAFQCRLYGEMSSEDQDRGEIEKLEAVLRSLERQKKIESFVVYDGYLEEVVLRKRDNSPHRIEFKQDSIITLYNLDFCNKVSSPMEYVDLEGNIQIAYKFNAIKELLQIQDGLCKVSDKFIFFLTVHCSYDGAELNNFINKPPNDALKASLERYKKLGGYEKNARIVRLFVVHLIAKYFSTYNFTSKILPVIKYNGLKGTPLLHFVVMGAKSPNTAGGVVNYQSIDDVINHKFVSYDSKELVNLDSELDEKDVPILNSLDFFISSKTYDKLWK